MNGKTLGDAGLRRGFLNVLYGMGKAASFVRAEGVNRLAGEIIVLEEGVDRHRHCSPIVGVTQINLIVGIQIIGQI